MKYIEFATFNVTDGLYESFNTNIYTAFSKTTRIVSPTFVPSSSNPYHWVILDKYAPHSIGANTGSSTILSGTPIALNKRYSYEDVYLNAVFGFDDNIEIPGLLDYKDVSLVTLKGKYKTKDIFTEKTFKVNRGSIYNTNSNIHYSYGFPCDFYYDGKLCDSICFDGVFNPDTNYYEYTLGEGYVHNVGINYNFTTISRGGRIFDFGSGVNLPSAIVNWFTENTEQVYDYIYTIKSNDGAEILSELLDSPPMVSARLNVIGNNKSLVLTSIYGTFYYINWVSISPPDKVFSGLSIRPNSNYISIPQGIDVDINWSSSIILYESYGTYRPIGDKFDISLYQNTAENERLDKTNYLTSVGTISGALRDETSITDMTITIEYNSVPNFNYVYIPSFNRYYYVTDIVSVRKNLWEISLSVDVLMTYKNAIRNLSAFVDRNENTFNPLLVDKKRIIEQGVEIENIEIDNDVFINPYDIGEETPLNLMFVLNGYKIDAVPNI